MEKIKWSFYWDGKIDKIKRSTVCSPSKKGGTGIIDIKLKLQALKMNVLRKFMSSSGKWKVLFEYCLFKASCKNRLGWFVLTCPKTVAPETQPFYRALINGFSQTKPTVRHHFTCINETSNVPLWNNTIITDNPNS